MKRRRRRGRGAPNPSRPAASDADFPNRPAPSAGIAELQHPALPSPTRCAEQFRRAQIRGRPRSLRRSPMPGCARRGLGVIHSRCRRDRRVPGCWPGECQADQPQRQRSNGFGLILPHIDLGPTATRGAMGLGEFAELAQLLGAVPPVPGWQKLDLAEVVFVRVDGALGHAGETCFTDRLGSTSSLGNVAHMRKGRPKAAFACKRDAASAYLFISSNSALPRSAGLRTVFTPAASSAANLPAAVPLPPEAMAPA